MKSFRKQTKALFVLILLLLSACLQVAQKDQIRFESLKSTIVKDSDRPETPAILHHSITPVAEMIARRAAHSATLLQNGKVLVCGGFSENAIANATAEIYEPKTKVFRPVANMTIARSSHSATLLPDGNVLIAGGYNGKYLSSIEIFDPRTETFTPAGNMTSPRSGHTSTRLNNGKILFAGGVGTGWSFLESAEVYDSKSGKCSPVSSMSTARESHTSTLLKNGKVLIVGGHKDRRAAIKIFSSAEIFDPESGKFTTTGSMTKIRHKHDAVLLADGKVLVTGGSDERDHYGSYSSAEIYDPNTGDFHSIANMNLTRYKHNGTSVLLKNGNVLIAGGADRMEVYYTKESRFVVVNGNFGEDRLFSCVTHLQDNKVLLTGGYDSKIRTSATAWVYSYDSK